MRILIVTPAPPRSRYGNRVTALRWARILRGLGHRVTLVQTYQGQPCGLLIALHAVRSHAAVRTFRLLHPTRPVVVALTGTDIYRDLPKSKKGVETLEAASRLVALNSKAQERLPPRLRGKVRVIFQSAQAPSGTPPGPPRGFDVCVVGHLRREKDPFRTAMAVRGLPAHSMIRVLHSGKAMDARMEALATGEERRNPRYRWLGELPPWRVRRLYRTCRLMVLSSRMEGGANVISEAAVAGLPVLAARIPGSVGLLGEKYPGYFPVGDTRALKKLLLKVEREPRFLAQLRSWMEALAPRFRAESEAACWAALLEELGQHQTEAKRPASGRSARARRPGG